MTVLAWHDVCYRKNIRLRFPSSLGFIQWKNLWHKDKGPRLNAKSSPGRSCISFPSWGAAGLVRVGTGNSPSVSLLPVYLWGAARTMKAWSRCCLLDTHLHSCQLGWLTAPDFRKTTGIQHNQCLPVCLRWAWGIQQCRVSAPLSTFWIWLVQCLNRSRHGEEQGKIRFLIQSGCAAWFCWDPHVCASRTRMEDGVFTGLWFACPLFQSGDTAVPKVPLTAAGSPGACHKRGNPNWLCVCNPHLYLLLSCQCDCWPFPSSAAECSFLLGCGHGTNTSMVQGCWHSWDWKLAQCSSK